jgi:hypothetical protein
MDEFERTIDELETLFVDPVFKATIESVHEMNEMIRDQPVTETEATQILSALNQQWRHDGYYHRMIHVTGEMIVGGGLEDIVYPDASQPDPGHYNAQPIQSKGFGMEVTTNLEDGVLSYQQVIVMKGRIELADENGIGGVTNEACTVPVVPEVSIECHEVTPQKIAAWLEIYHPDTKNLIDECIMQADDEAGAIMNLRDTPLSVPEGSKKDIRELKQYLNNYISEYITFEQHIPYRAVLFGPLKLFNADTLSWEDHDAMSEKRSLLNIQKASVTQNRRTQEFKIWLEATIIVGSKIEVKTVRIPLSTLESLESGREILRSE